MHTIRSTCRRAVIVASSATIAATTLTTVAPAQPAPKDAALAARPILTVTHATDFVTLEKFGNKVELALGVYAVAGDEPFEVQAHRTSYNQPIHASVVTTAGDVALPDGTVKNFRKLNGLFTLRVYDKDGNTVVSRSLAFCPWEDEVRVRDDAPPPKNYPQECPYNPYTVGGIYGIDAGYAKPILGDYGHRVGLDLGRYTAKVWVAKPYRDALGLSLAETTTTVKMRVVRGEIGGCEPRGNGCKSGTSSKSTTRTDSKLSAKPHSSRPTKVASRAALAPAVAPDLRSLPAYAISLDRGFVSFAATVWNAGSSPLVIDGFRRTDEDVMDAFQYFYDSDGNQVGLPVPAGEMEWDARHGHEHWHFRDFARYRLLDADKDAIVRSRKEAFCLANTDAVDYTVEGANWHPFNTDLHTSCGNYTAIGVREVLDSGSGDTYYQGLPGQSFNVKELPNGKYFISVEANPNNVMEESSTTNNVSYRKIFLKGTAEHRRVFVPKVGIIDEGAFF